MVQGASNKPKTKEVQFLNPWDYTTLTAFLKDLMANPKIEMDEMEKPLTYPTFLFDPMTNPMKAFGSTNPMPMILADPTTPTQMSKVSAGLYDGEAATTAGLWSNSRLYAFNATTWDRIRTPTIFKAATATTIAATAIWTPTAGKKFRLMGAQGILASGSAIATASSWELQDSATSITLKGLINGAALVAAPLPNIVVTLDLKPNGYLSSTINNVLNCIMTVAITTGGLSWIVWGTEE